MSVNLDRIVAWGRSRREYELMFRLTAEDLSKGVLDCGGGPASFVAEASASGYRAVSVDPIYTLSGSAIRERFEATTESIMRQVHATPADWKWSYHRSPEDLLKNRRRALQGFLTDYERGKCEHRYVIAELPSLPFRSGLFGLAVCSHLLFLYSDALSADFHIRSVREMCRVAQEVRVFPLLALSRKRSPHVDTVRKVLERGGLVTAVVDVEYELQRDGNQMLRVFRQ